MINNLSEYLIGFAAGIRFRANFSIEDQLGKILDTILYAQKSYFNPYDGAILAIIPFFQCEVPNCLC